MPLSRWPTAINRRSPMAWPTLSLMTLNRSRSRRMTATGSDPSGRDEARACAIRSVRSSRFGQPGRRVVQRPALGGIHQPGVVERDRGELGEAGQRVDLALAPSSIGFAGGQPEHPDDPPGGRQRHPDHGAEHPRRRRHRAARPGVVGIDRDAACRSTRPSATPSPMARPNPSCPACSPVPIRSTTDAPSGSRR